MFAKILFLSGDVGVKCALYFPPIKKNLTICCSVSESFSIRLNIDVKNASQMNVLPKLSHLSNKQGRLSVMITQIISVELFDCPTYVCVS